MDTKIISAYNKNKIPGLKQYIDNLSATGKHFFVTKRIADEFRKTDCNIPPQLTIFENPDAEQRAESAYNEVIKVFNVTTPKFITDVHWLLECGHGLHSCEDIPLKYLLRTGFAFALTLNTELVDCFLCDVEHRRKFEEIVDCNGLEHLADVRLLQSNGDFEDISAFETA